MIYGNDQKNDIEIPIDVYAEEISFFYEKLS